MAYRPKRRSSRALDDLPGLFDDIKPQQQPISDPIADIIQSHRRLQTSAAPGQIEIDQASGAITVSRKLQFISFGSGSSGNCAYLGIAGEGGVLIDAGIDADKVADAMRRNALPLEKVAGIVLTHDHSDHVKYAYALLRKNPKMLLYCTPRTLEGMLRRHSISRRIKDYHKGIFKEFAFDAGPFSITPFEVSHDGSDNVGFCFEADGARFVVATDMGIITDRADHYMRQANYLMVEANYDAAMLASGSYPEHLKARIRGAAGHLDNAVTAKYLASLTQSPLSDVYLCHLSHDNNTPETALRTICDALRQAGRSVGDGSGSVSDRSASVRVSALPRFECSPLHIHRLPTP